MNKKDPEYNATMLKKQHMDLWNSLAQSDMKYLKKVSFGSRKFSPVGQGWGYNVEYDYPANGDVILIVAKVSIWTRLPENIFGPIAGSRTFWHKDMKRPAEDAGKMALTDALTKGLSHLGCDADVFLGKHDNKYSADDGKSEINPF